MSDDYNYAPKRDNFSFQPPDKRRDQLKTRAQNACNSLRYLQCIPVDIMPDQPGYVGDRWTYRLTIEYDPNNGPFTRDMQAAIEGQSFRIDTYTDIINGRGMRFIELICTPRKKSKRDVLSFPEVEPDMLVDIRPPWETINAAQRNRMPSDRATIRRPRHAIDEPDDMGIDEDAQDSAWARLRKWLGI